MLEEYFVNNWPGVVILAIAVLLILLGRGIWKAISEKCIEKGNSIGKWLLSSRQRTFKSYAGQLEAKIDNCLADINTIKKNLTEYYEALIRTQFEILKQSKDNQAEFDRFYIWLEAYLKQGGILTPKLESIKQSVFEWQRQKSLLAQSSSVKKTKIRRKNIND